MMAVESDYEAWTSNPDPDTGEQFLLRRYRDSHGTTRTVAWRESESATWGPEHILFAASASEVAP